MTSSHVSAHQGLSIDVPDSWEVFDSSPDLLALLPAERRAGAFTENVTVISGPAVELDAEALLEAELPRLSAQLTDFALLDLGEDEVSGLTAVRLLGCYRAGTSTLTLDQWHLLGTHRRWTVSFTAEATGYGAIAELGEAIVASIEIVS